MVAAHVSDLFRRSKACMHALSVLMRCKLDTEISTRASSLYNLIDIHSKVVASIVNKAEPLEVHLMSTPASKMYPSGSDSKRHTHHANGRTLGSGQASFSQPPKGLPDSESKLKSVGSSSSGNVSCNLGKGIASFPVDASDLANFLTKDWQIGFNCSVQVFLGSMLTDKQELCFSVVSLLWYKLISVPETKPSAESTSAQQGWRQVQNLDDYSRSLQHQIV